MIGRGARERTEKANVYIFPTSHMFNFHRRKLDMTKNNYNFLQQSLHILETSLHTSNCTWREMLRYFREDKQDDWACKTCSNCKNAHQNESDILCHPLFFTSLYILKGNLDVSKTDMCRLLVGSPSQLQHVPLQLLNHFENVRDKEAPGIKSYKNASNFIIKLQYQGYITIQLPKQGFAGVILKLTLKSLDILNTPGVQVYPPLLPSTFECFLPTEENLNEGPFPLEEFVSPDEESLKKILETEVFTDELWEVCLQIPILKGSILLDVREENRKFCIPLQSFVELWCKSHKQMKVGYSSALKPYHRWPKYITWHVKFKWKNYKALSNTFVDSMSGLHIKWYCGHFPFNCTATKTWTSLAVETHNNCEHVIIQETFHQIKDANGTILNRHLHPCGAKAFKSKGKKNNVVNDCCTYNKDKIDSVFLPFCIDQDLPLKSVSQPVFSYMEELLQAYIKDPLAAQVNPEASYNRARNIMAKKKKENRPWLTDVNNAKELTNFNRVTHLKNYIDMKDRERNKSSNRKKYPCYIGPMIHHEQDVFTVLCTDLFGITLFNLCSKQGVVSIDGTGVTRQDARNLMMYVCTVDTKNVIKRSDELKSGTISVFEVFCIGKSTTTAHNLQGAFTQFKNLCSTVRNTYNPPRFVKLGKKINFTL